MNNGNGFSSSQRPTTSSSPRIEAHCGASGSLPQGKSCAASRREADASPRVCALPHPARRYECRQGCGPCLREEAYPADALNRKLLEVEDVPERLQREPMREAFRRSPNVALTLREALSILEEMDEEEGVEPHYPTPSASGGVNDFTMVRRKEVHHTVIKMKGSLYGFFNHPPTQDEADNLAEITILRTLEREGRLFDRSDTLVKAFVWTVARNVRYEAWKRQPTVGMRSREGTYLAPETLMMLAEQRAMEEDDRDASDPHPDGAQDNSRRYSRSSGGSLPPFHYGSCDVK